MVAGVVLVAEALDRRRSVRRTSGRGVVIVQIDGLGLPALRTAIASGAAPFLGGLLDRRQATVSPWFALIPPTTPASQAGMLHGHNDEIPGFRWYEKATGRLLVANHAGDAAEIARRQSDGHGLLAPDGASIGNLMTGDARRTYLTMATVAEEPRAPGTIIRLRTFLLSPINAVRIVAGMAGEFVAELYQGRRQAIRQVRPRMHRGFDSATERAVLNGAVRILSTELVIAEMRMGTPVIYVDFTGYDSVAHHSGPERAESIRAVRGIDHEIERIVRAMPRARRPYELVVVSDHGQSLGRPFVDAYHQSLEEFVVGLMGEGASAQSSKETEHSRGGGLIARDLAALVGIGPLLEAIRAAVDKIGFQSADPADKPDLVVCASGNLAHLYFPVEAGRLSMERIEHLYPGLVRGLINHPAIGLVLVRSDQGGALAIGRGGRRGLGSGELERQDPLIPYGPLALPSLRRLDSFGNVGDLVVLSTVDPATAEVVSFEDLVGCHGGLGGAQSEPFVLYPATWTPPAGRMTGAPELHVQLRRWLDEL